MAVGQSSVYVAKGVLVTTWNFTGSETGDPEVAPQFPVKSVQVTGTFNGATITIEGSNDGVTYAPLSDVTGTALTFTANGVEKISENTRYVRPRVSTGTVTAVRIALQSQETLS